MAKPHRQHRTTTIEIHPDLRPVLLDIAASLGYFQTRGAGAGTTGSLSKLLEAIATGEIKLSAQAANEAAERELQ